VSSTPTTKTARPGGLARYIPILSWLPSYNRTWLSADLLAGLTLWGPVVPEAMAYAGVAGLPPQALIFDATAQDALDITSAEVLKGLIKELRDGGIEVYAAEMHAPVIAFARKSGLSDVLGEEHVFPTVDAALAAIRARAKETINPSPNSKEIVS